jgi:hypothetical protein
MSKENLSVKRISKEQAGTILLKYHYLSGISKGFKSGHNYGCFKENELVGVAIFTGFPVPELAKGMFGLERTEQEGLFELSRLCLEPNIQKTEHNLASWFLSKSIKMLRKEVNVRALLSYADEAYHSGVVYKASNFKYYGLSSPKKDFYIKQSDDTFIKHSRGKVSGVLGEWRQRTRKHRFVIVYDKYLKIKWVEELWKR